MVTAELADLEVGLGRSLEWHGKRACGDDREDGDEDGRGEFHDRGRTSDSRSGIVKATMEGLVSGG